MTTSRSLSGLLCVALLCAGCRRDPLMMATTDVGVSPVELSFGRVALGASVAVPLELTNRGEAAASLQFGLDGPFTLDEAPDTLGAGLSLPLTVRFAPDQLGVVQGTLRLGPGLAEVPLLGEGVARCESSEPCTTSRFDLDTRECIEGALADGEACSAPCLQGAGACAGGYCIGTSSDCADGDACTIDACRSDGTCVHPALECEVLDPCQATRCEPATGCVRSPVDDGVPCGAATCEAAHICLGGECRLTPRANAAADCRYTALSAGPFTTCAVTVGGGLRCWGDNQLDKQGRGYASFTAAPGLAPGLTGLTSVAIGQGTTWVGLASGRVVQTNGPRVLNTSATRLEANAAGLVCSLAQAEASCVDTNTDGGLVSAATEVTALSVGDDGELCVAQLDGGLRCGAPGALSPLVMPGAASEVALAERGSGCARLGSEVHCWGELADAGASPWAGGFTALAAVRRAGVSGACAAGVDGISCLPADFPSAVVQTPLPASASALALGSLHGCALLVDGRVSCWGDNGSGQLGDRGRQPLGVQLLALRATWLGEHEREVVLSSDGGDVVDLRSTLVTDDAGSSWAHAVTRAHRGTPADYELGCPCTRSDAGVFCGERRSSLREVGPLSALPTTCTPLHSDPRSMCLGDDGGQVRCFAQGDAGPVEVLAWNAGAPVVALEPEWANAGPVTGLCAVRVDGQVRCSGLTSTDSVPETLTGVSSFCLGQAGDSLPTNGTGASNGCALVGSGELLCWGAWVGSATPRAPAGAWPLSRQVVCGRRHACSLHGSNGVQCWGDNRSGQLGFDGPASTRASPVAMPEPVLRLAAGAEYTCALLRSGKVACWGANDHSQLGAPALAHTPWPRLVVE